MKRVSLLEKLGTTFAEAFEACGIDPTLSRVIVSDRPDLGQFQCNGALAGAKPLRKNPRELAQCVLDSLQHKENFSELSLAGPGFINISVTDAFLAAHIREILTDPRVGCGETPEPRSIILDFGGPNVAKPMHVGHLRSTIIGDSLRRISLFLGHRTTADIHLGDWGLQMGMLIAELKRRNPALPYFDASSSGPYPSDSPVTIDDLEAMYPAAAARAKENPSEMEEARSATAELQQGRPGYVALWKHFVAVSIAALKEDFGKLGVHFDLWLGESHYNDRLPAMIGELKERGLAVLSEGAVVIPVSLPGDKKEVPPLLIEKSDGAYLYGTTDLATVEDRVKNYGADLDLYVVDKRQHLHFEQVFRAARIASFVGSAGLEHIAFGTMNGPDGKPFKTRAGGVMKLKDLIAMVTGSAEKKMQESHIAEEYDASERGEIARKVGIATLKFADLSNHRASDYVFDLDTFSRFEGRTGPYLLYSAVRIKSILRKADERKLCPGEILPPVSQAERDLMLQLSYFSDAVRSAFADRAPNHLCDFAFNLAQLFSRFYQQCHILSEENDAVQSSWLSLCRLCLREVELVLDLLGIGVPERM